MFRLALVPAVQAAASGEPRHRALHGATVAAEPLGGLDAPAGDARSDVPGAEPPAQVIVVVTLVTVELGGPSPTRSAPGPDRRDTPHQSLQALTVVGVRGGDADGQGQTGPLSDQMDF